MSQAATTSPEARPERLGPPERAPRLPRFADAAVTRARLSLVGPSRSEAPLAPFVALVFVLLMGGVGGLLAFNTSMQSDSFAAAGLQTRADALSAKQQSLQIDLADLKDPQSLAARAKALGMVVPPGAAFIRLSDGKVLGRAQPATTGGAMRINPLPAALPKVFAPAPRVIRVPKAITRSPRGTDGSGGSVTHDRSGSTTSTGKTGGRQ